MAMETRYLDPDLLRAQKRRRQYASKVDRCEYHEIFASTLESTPINTIPITNTEVFRSELKDLYRPLAPFQMRVLLIEAGEFDEPLKTSLCAVDLLLEGGVIDPATRDHYTYEAVSHSWGDLRTSGVLHCNDKLVAFREPQIVMLKHLRSKLERRCVWLDTICINQDDNEERAAQVSKMFTIFKHAQRVLVWLGLPKQGTAQVFKVLAKMKATRLIEEMDGPEVQEMDERESSPHRSGWRPRFVPSMCSSCHSDFASGIGELSDFSWFRRTWVRQEIFAAEVATLLCGPIEFSWPEFVGHICFYAEDLGTHPSSAGMELLRKQLMLLNPGFGRNRLNDDDEKTGSLSFVYQLFDQDFSSSPRHPPDLFSVLSSSASFESTDLRDIVYGVLGMSNTRTSVCCNGQPFLVVDYNQNAAQVFCKATEYFIQREEGLDAMFLAQFNRDPLGRMASWCPYWAAMDCEPGQLRQLCHVNLLDSHSNQLTRAFDGLSWPRVLNAESIDIQNTEQLCYFKECSIEIEGHALGVIKDRRAAGEARNLTYMAFDRNFFESTTSSINTGDGLNEPCRDYAPLRIEHLSAKLDSFLKGLKDNAQGKTLRRLRDEVLVRHELWPQEELDRLCLAAVPMTTRDGDLLCSLKASSAFVILRPLEIKGDICRVQFVGIAFAAEGIFDMSKLVQPEPHDGISTHTPTDELLLAEREVFSNITANASNDEFDDAHSNSEPPASAGTHDAAPAKTEASNHIDRIPRHERYDRPRTQSSSGASAERQLRFLFDDSGDETFTSRLDLRTPLENPLLEKPSIGSHSPEQQEDMFFQSHFGGPVKSLKMTFDIV